MGRLFAGTPFDIPPRCDRCCRPLEECDCPAELPPRTPVEKQRGVLGTEKRKRGKVVTLVRGLVDEENHLTELLTQLQSTCGAGGTVRDGVIELQGQHLDRVRAVLLELGYRVTG